MKAESELINILCYRLPGDISRSVHNEFDGRWKEIENIWEYSHNQYKMLMAYKPTVRNLLAVSTFYRRVLSGFDGARDLFTTIDKFDTQKEIPIAIGKYRLNRKEYNKLLGIQIAFDNIKKGYGLSDHFFDYFEITEFLSNCRDLYYSNVKPEQHNPSTDSTDELPF